MICYAEKRFFEWYEDDLSVSLRASGGSYGGGSEALIVTSYGLDSYNQQMDEEVAQPLRAHGGGDTMPKVVLETNKFDAVCIDNHPNDSRVTVRDDGIVQSLTSRCGTGGGQRTLCNDKEKIILKEKHI